MFRKLAMNRLRGTPPAEQSPRSAACSSADDSGVAGELAIHTLSVAGELVPGSVGQAGTLQKLTARGLAISLGRAIQRRAKAPCRYSCPGLAASATACRPPGTGSVNHAGQPPQRIAVTNVSKPSLPLPKLDVVGSNPIARLGRQEVTIAASWRLSLPTPPPSKRCGISPSPDAGVPIGDSHDMCCQSRTAIRHRVGHPWCGSNGTSARPICPAVPPASSCHLAPALTGAGNWQRRCRGRRSRASSKGFTAACLPAS